MYLIETRAGRVCAVVPVWHLDQLDVWQDRVRIRRDSDGAVLAFVGVPRPARDGRAPAWWMREQRMRWLRESAARWQGPDKRLEAERVATWDRVLP